MRPTLNVVGVALLALAGITVACTRENIYIVAPEDAAARRDDAGAARRDAKSDDEAPDATDDAASAELSCSQTATRSLIAVENDPNRALGETFGGAVSDGHYTLIRAVNMTEGTSPDLAVDLWLEEGRYEWQAATSTGESTVRAGTIAFNGTNVSMTVECGDALEATKYAYSYSAGTLRIQFTKKSTGEPWLYFLARDGSR